MTATKSLINMRLYLDAAVEIGDHLVATAIWDCSNKYCTWLGARDINDPQIAKYSNRNSALSPEFYSGTAGVAYFLIKLFQVTRNEEYKKVAMGAWLRSAQYMKTRSFPASSISFFAGELGLLYVGYNFIEVDKGVQHELQPALDWLTSTLEGGLSVKHSLDVIGGNAGAIPALLQLSKKYPIEIFEKTAIACAEELISLANWQGDMCIWASPKVHGVELDTPPTTGYSHGASGIAVALLEMYHHTGEKRYQKYGQGAFAFENSLFNDEEGNWVDTRYPQVKRNGKIFGTFRHAWCHGAPGIALANLRASFLDDENQNDYRYLAEVAIQTAIESVQERIISNPTKDATLCHGILGTSDIILSYARKTENINLKTFSQEITAQYLSKFESIIDLPSGIVAGGYNPCIMVGHSGIGLHCLRQFSEEDIGTPLMFSL